MKEQHNRTAYLPIVAFLSLSLAVVIATVALRSRDGQIVRSETELALEQVANRVEKRLDRRTFAVKIMGRAESHGTLETIQDFDAHAEGVLKGFPGLTAVSWIDEGGFVRRVNPREAFGTVWSDNVFSSDEVKQTAELAKEHGGIHFTPPYTLEDGSQAISAYYFVADSDGKAKGYMSGRFLLEPLLAELTVDAPLNDYAFELREADELLFRDREWGVVEEQASYVSSGNFEILNREWQLSVGSHAEAWTLAGLPFSTSFLLLGLLLSMGISGALHFWFSRDRLQRRGARERNELEARLFQAQKMEAVGRLAGGVAHDFNNLLTAILGNADLLESFSQTRLDSNSQEAIDQIRVAGERATQLTTQLLTMSRRQVVQPRLIDMNVELRTLQGVLKRLIREDIEFHEQLSDQACVVELDPGQLSQIAINLVVNAVDVTPTGGSLTLHTSRQRSEREGVIRNWIVLRVDDTGIGMDEVTRARALEPFYTTKEKGKGTGLGLATVDGIAKGAGGFVEISHNDPCGTSVSVWLPASQRKIDTPAIIATNELRGGTVLIVEDDEGVRDIASRMFIDAGYQVVAASNGQEAMKLVDEGGRFDLLFTDAVMPQLGGLDLLRELRNRKLNFTAVVTSGYADVLDLDELQSLGAHFLSKPYTEQSVREAVHSASSLESALAEPS